MLWIVPLLLFSVTQARLIPCDRIAKAYPGTAPILPPVPASYQATINKYGITCKANGQSGMRLSFQDVGKLKKFQTAMNKKSKSLEF